MATFQKQKVARNESATGKGVDFKMETILRISCVQ
jgi:hypothetical protein